MKMSTGFSDKEFIENQNERNFRGTVGAEAKC